jgi:hypothetical protein
MGLKKWGDDHRRVGKKRGMAGEERLGREGKLVKRGFW